MEQSARDRLAAIANQELEAARCLIEDTIGADQRFAALIERSDVLYEFVYDHGMGTLLVATARRTGPLTWK